MKWKAACLEILKWGETHFWDGNDDVWELAENVWGDDAFEIHAAYLKHKKIKGKELLTMKEMDEKFKKVWAAKPIGNDLRTPEGQLAYMKAAEEEAQL